MKPMESKTAAIKSVIKCPTCGGECSVNTSGTTHYYISKTENLKTELAEKDKAIERLLSALIELKKDIEADGYNFRLGTMDKVNTAILKSLNQ